MLARVDRDRFGNLQIDPVSARRYERAFKHLTDMGVKPDREWSLIYLQGDAADEFLDTDVPRKAAREVREGFTVCVRLSEELWNALVGYDFNG